MSISTRQHDQRAYLPPLPAARSDWRRRHIRTLGVGVSVGVSVGMAVACPLIVGLLSGKQG